MNNLTKNLLVIASGLAIGGAIVKGIDYSCYHKSRIDGVVESIRISNPTEMKQINSDNIPLPFTSRNKWSLPSYTVLTLKKSDGKEFECAFYNGYTQEEISNIRKPNIGDKVHVEREGFGVYVAPIGNEPRFADGTPRMSYAPRVIAVTSWGNLENKVN